MTTMAVMRALLRDFHCVLSKNEYSSLGETEAEMLQPASTFPLARSRKAGRNGKVMTKA